MSMDNSLKLVESEPADPDVFPLERRRADRHGINGHVTAVRTERLADGMHNRICSLNMVNISESGLGALVQEPVECGSSIAVFFPPHGPERGFDLFGVVVRCERRDTGFELGIRLQQKAAA